MTFTRDYFEREKVLSEIITERDRMIMALLQRVQELETALRDMNDGTDRS